MNSNKRLLGLVLVFCCGALLGVSVALWITDAKLDALIYQTKLPERDQVRTTLISKLGLSEEQAQNIDAEFVATEPQRMLSRVRARPLLNAPAYIFLNGVSRWLDSGQLTRLDGVIDDALTANRTGCLQTLTLRLKLSRTTREAFDKILAANANETDVVRPTVSETCVALLERSASAMTALLDPERMKIYETIVREAKMVPASATSR